MGKDIISQIRICELLQQMQAIKQAGIGKLAEDKTIPLTNLISCCNSQ